MTTKADGSTVTSCRVPRGREYRVRFDRNGEAVAVETVYRRWNDTGRVYRSIWTRTSGRPMTVLVKCAVRAALAEREPQQ